MLLISLLRNSLVPNKDVAVKFPSHRLGSAGMLVLYGMTAGEEGSVEMLVSPMGTKLGTSLRGTCGLDAGRENEKQVVFSTEGKDGSIVSMSMLQLAATRSA